MMLQISLPVPLQRLTQHKKNGRKVNNITSADLSIEDIITNPILFQFQPGF